MRIFMLGWEFPPYISGGLGTACYGLTKAMSDIGLKITFVLPKSVQADYSSHVKLLSPQQSPASVLSKTSYSTHFDELKNVTIKTIESYLSPYETPEEYQEKIEEIIRNKRIVEENTSYTIESHCVNHQADYGHNLMDEVHRFAGVAVSLAMNEDFDLIHAHDWMTYPAGIAVAAITGKPLVVQVHSTEFDRSGEHVNQQVYDIERKGMHAADKVIAVSHLTKNIIIGRYGVPGNRVEVVHNGVDQATRNLISSESGITKDEKIVLFLGRITMQKGPEYFLQAAKKVLEVMNNVKFVMAGSGDMMNKVIEMAANMGIGDKVLFTGFLRGKDVQKVYELADLYVMPSVSEPFGIAPLEALNNDIPVLISKQSGVSEVLTHVLKVDFWDVEEMANKIVAVLKYPPLQMTLREHGNFEVRKLRWEDSAAKCAKIYGQTLLSKL